MKKFLCILAIAAVALTSTPARAAPACTVITSIPWTITAEGIYCFKANLASGLRYGNMIDIQADNVFINMNGYMLDGLGAGARTAANGIYALDRRNITVHNGTIRGFNNGVHLDGGGSSGHLLE